MGNVAYLILLGGLALGWGLVERYRRRAHGRYTERVSIFIQGPLSLVLFGMMIYAFFGYGVGTGLLSILVAFGVGAIAQGP